MGTAPLEMANFIYVDNSNLWIEGMHVSAVARGLAPDIWTAQTTKICDYDWKVDFGRLYRFLTGGDGDVGRCVLVGSTPPANEALWAEARRRGFEVVLHDRNRNGREKKIDTSLTTQVMADSYERMRVGVDEVTLVAGDSDYVPTVENLCARGFDVYVTFWEHAARELKQACTKFVSMDSYLDNIRVPSS